MLFSDVSVVVFAAALTVELFLIFAGFRRADRRALTARMTLAVPALSTPTKAVSVGPQWRDTTFDRHPTGHPHAREQREVVSALRRVGIPARHAAGALVVVEALAATLLAAAGFLVAQRLFPSGALAWAWMPLTLIGAASGWSIPMLLAHGAADRRAAAVVRGLPEALELLIICVEAGLAFESGLERITEALRESEPVLAEELALTAADLRVLASLDEGLANLAARVDVPEVRSVVTILSQSLRYGSPLADSLRTAATEMRGEALIKLEERGNRLPTLLTLPMMLLIFPTIFLVVVGPAALRALEAFKR